MALRIASALETAPPRPPEPGELAALHDWLDDGLRRGRRGRLAAEYPLTLGARRPEAHRVIAQGGAPRAHAMLHPIEIAAAGRTLRAGMIGLVYTDPAWRRRGLAGRCVEACAEALAEAGAGVALLWSDRHAFYARLGFEPAGTEWRVAFDATLARQARGRAARRLRIRPFEPRDAPTLEALRERRCAHALQPSGALASLAVAPETRVVVAESGRRVRGWAACGRGDDFAGVIHDWAGTPDAVLACVAALAETGGAAVLFANTLDEPPVARLLRSGAEASAGCFALARLLAPELCFEVLVPDAPRGLRVVGPPEAPVLRHSGGALALTPAEALALFFGPQPDRVGDALAASERAALARRLPWPLYVGGFDSI